MENNENVPVPVPATTQSVKKWYRHNGLLTIVALAIIACISIWLYYRQTQNQISTNSGNVLRLPGIAQSNQPTAPALNYTGPIAQTCSTEKKSSGNYAPGQVDIGFSSDMSVSDIHKFLNDNGYKIAGDAGGYLLNVPTEVDIHWTDAFNQENQITLDEVNNFLSKSAQEPYIESINVDSGWNPGPVQLADKNHVRAIDRWDYFTITFKDQVGEIQFFKDYPEATLFGDGEIQGQYLLQQNGIFEAVVLYKAQPALDILNKIKTQAGISDGQVQQQPAFGSHGSVEHQLGLFLSPFYITGSTNFALNVPASDSQIQNILANYPDIDLAQTLPSNTPAYEQRLNFVTIEVPVGEEQCYATELSKQKGIDSAEVDAYLSPQ